ncbi:MAG: hypothetical protein ACK4JD_13180 [Thermoflexales bacterium]
MPFLLLIMAIGSDFEVRGGLGYAFARPNALKLRVFRLNLKRCEAFFEESAAQRGAAHVEHHTTGREMIARLLSLKR